MGVKKNLVNLVNSSGRLSSINEFYPKSMKIFIPSKNIESIINAMLVAVLHDAERVISLFLFIIHTDKS